MSDLNLESPISDWLDAFTDPAGVKSNNAAGTIADFDPQALQSILKLFQMDQYGFNAQQVKEQRKWLEYMSNTSYQRAMEDMRRAGLNPLIALGQLQPASTPSLSAASGSQTSASALINAIAQVLMTNSKLTMDLFKTMFNGALGAMK